MKLTDLAIGEVDNEVGWNLNTPFAFSCRTLPALPPLSKDIGLYCDEAFVSVGLRGVGKADWGGNAGADPYLPIGKFSSMGDRELGSKAALAGELRYPSRLIPPFPWFESSSSGGGVGVRGGAGIGKLDAMAFGGCRSPVTTCIEEREDAPINRDFESERTEYDMILYKHH